MVALKVKGPEGGGRKGWPHPPRVRRSHHPGGDPGQLLTPQGWCCKRGYWLPTVTNSAQFACDFPGFSTKGPTSQGALSLRQTGTVGCPLPTCPESTPRVEYSLGSNLRGSSDAYNTSARPGPSWGQPWSPVRPPQSSHPRKLPLLNPAPAEGSDWPAGACGTILSGPSMVITRH